MARFRGAWAAGACALALVMSAAGPALAQDVDPPPPRLEPVVGAEEKLSPKAEEALDGVEPFGPFDGHYRLWGQFVDAPGFEADDDRRAALYQRLRAQFAVERGTLGLVASVDAFAGRLVGDAEPEVPVGVDTDTSPRGEVFGDVENFIDPRQLFVIWGAPVGELRVGLQLSNFGLGLVANDGIEEPRELFNQEYGGDRGLRVLFATKHAALLSQNRIARNIYLALGADYVYRDDNASLLDEDRASQFIGTVFYRDADPLQPLDTTFFGAYIAARDQEDADGDTLEATAIDLSGARAWLAADDTVYVRLAAESALITGSTSRTYTSSGESETDVLGLGAAAEAELGLLPASTSLRLKAGYASGDANTDDDTLYRFRFDTNYNAGLILFDHYIPALTRASYARLTDPTQSGAPPKGVEGFIADGGIENAIFLNPQLIFGEVDGLMTGVGFLWAYAAEPVLDPFNTFAAGGELVGLRGGEASRDLGSEVNVAARYRHELVDGLWLEGKGEYGIFFPGDAFDDARGGSASAVSLVRARLALVM